MKPITTHDELLRIMLEWRGIETPCVECAGAGKKTYGSTATWRGGVGGQMMTTDVCDHCWGSGDADQPWPSWRRA